MSLDLLLFVILAAKMVATATLVVAASFLAERSGPAIAASIITLPVSAGPAYVILAIEHDAAFVAGSALGTMVGNAAGLVFIVVYALLAQRRSLVVSLASAIVAWSVLAVLFHWIAWTFPAAIMLNVAAFMLAAVATRRLERHAGPPGPTIRRWYDLPFRAAIVATLVVTVTTLSTLIGPLFTGVLAIFPIALTSMALILHPRIGGVAAGTLLADAPVPLIGFVFSTALVHLTAQSWGVWPALGAALVAGMAWNFAVWKMRQRVRT